MTQYEKLIAEMTVEKLAELRITDTENSNGFWTGDFDGYSCDWDEALGMEVDWLNEEVEDGIKRCPFCGGEAETNNLMKPDINDRCWIECRECGISTKICDNEQEAIDAWNRRA